MDGTTLKRMKAPRCGNPDPVHKGVGLRAFILQGKSTRTCLRNPLSWSVSGSKWDKLDLTFKIGQYSRTLSRKAVDEIIGKAFAVTETGRPCVITTLVPFYILFAVLVKAFRFDVYASG